MGMPNRPRCAQSHKSLTHKSHTHSFNSNMSSSSRERQYDALSAAYPRTCRTVMTIPMHHRASDTRSDVLLSTCVLGDSSGLDLDPHALCLPAAHA